MRMHFAFLVLCCSSTFLVAQELVQTDYEKGYIKDGKKFLVWSQYDLTFLLSDRFRPSVSWFYDSISISGDGTQVVVFLFGLLTINVIAGMYNAGMLSNKWAVDESVLSPILVNAHIGVGSLISLIALPGFFGLYLQIQSFAKALEFDRALMNSSNLARLTYVFLSYTFLALYAQWILRDGIKLRRTLKTPTHLPLAPKQTDS